jgi:hypothetical protein
MEKNRETRNIEIHRRFDFLAGFLMSPPPRDGVEASPVERAHVRPWEPQSLLYAVLALIAVTATGDGTTGISRGKRGTVARTRSTGNHGAGELGTAFARGNWGTGTTARGTTTAARGRSTYTGNGRCWVWGPGSGSGSVRGSGVRGSDHGECCYSSFRNDPSSI